MRAFSEWNMFALKYKWERDTNFSSAMARKAAGLRRCDPALFGNTSAVRALSTAALARYLRRCFGGGRAMQYLTTSLYAVCIEYGLRLFEREQFLFLRYEDLKRMQPRAIMRLVARFTGLPAEAPSLEDAATLEKCTPWKSRPKRSKAPARQLAAAAAPLQRIFAPYSRMLTELVHPTFGWSSKDHSGFTLPQ